MKKFSSIALLVIAVAALALAGCSTAASQQPLAAAPGIAQAASASAPVTATSGADLEQAYTNVYERVNPSVVSIRVVLNASAGTGSIPDFHFNLPGFPNVPTPQAPQGGLQQAEGSGFVFDKQGHIATNNHVVNGADKIVVTFSDGSEAAATLVGADPDSDLAVIKVDVDPSLLTPVALSTSDALKVGQIVVAIGNPFGESGSMSTGIVSGLGRLLDNSQTPNGNYSIPDVVQTDAAINPGNSGGPLLNLQGELIGVNTAIDSPVRANSGVGYAVPVDIVKQVVPELISKGKVQHPWLGISGTSLNADFARAMKLDANQRGVLVVQVVTGGPSEKAGLKASQTTTQIDGLDAQIGGDVIVGINDQPVKVFDDLLAYIVRHAQVGQQVTLHILRDGKAQDVQVTLGARPSSNTP